MHDPVGVRDRETAEHPVDDPPPGVGSQRARPPGVEPDPQRLGEHILEDHGVPVALVQRKGRLARHDVRAGRQLAESLYRVADPRVGRGPRAVGQQRIYGVRLEDARS